MTFILSRAEVEALGGHQSLALMNQPDFFSRSTTITSLFETSYARAILLGLQRKHVYQGTVPETEIARRRAKNRAARKARKTQRRNAKG
ncbi:hypothetical protein [Nocardia rhizosphaerae]|uniref:Uncharacterized protein n=1 Tax=Nocardia rhizosphaerae TaxID=1691571 RepID=A0ABV8LE03_9NOCA